MDQIVTVSKVNLDGRWEGSRMSSAYVTVAVRVAAFRSLDPIDLVGHEELKS
jgi:hypothetical protein